ncbi:MAG: restriction endonuclease subunit S [Akkermansia sp.]
MSKDSTRRITLGAVCKLLQSGDSIPSSKITDMGNYPVFGANGMRGYTQNKNFTGSCAIIGRQGAYCGNVHYYSGEAYMTEHAVIAEPNNEANARFLAYYLGLLPLIRLQGQSAQPGLAVSNLRKLKLDLPEMAVQKRVAKLLSALDSKIEHNKRMIERLEKQAQLLYDYWFLQFDFPDENGRPYRSSGGKMVWNETLKREIPAGWSVEKLESLCLINSDTYKEREKWEEVRYLDTSNLTENRVDTIETIRVGIDKLPSRAKRKVKDEDILFSTVRPNQLHYGIMIDPEPNLLVSTGFAVLTAKKESISPYLVYAIVTSAPMVNALQKKAELATSAYPSIHPEQLAEIMIPIPPQDSGIMQAYDNLTKPLYRRIDACLKDNKELTSQRDYLLPLLMTGQVRVEA